MNGLSKELVDLADVEKDEEDDEEEQNPSKLGGVSCPNSVRRSWRLYSSGRRSSGAIFASSSTCGLSNEALD